MTLLYLLSPDTCEQLNLVGATLGIAVAEYTILLASVVLVILSETNEGVLLAHTVCGENSTIIYQLARHGY